MKNKLKMAEQKKDPGFLVLEEVFERMWLPGDPQARPGLLETPHPSRVLRMYILPSVSIAKFFQGHSIERAMCC